jgi:mRNA-degrading endonuclease RelE of RelBE toxin-antitoxin system
MNFEIISTSEFEKELKRLNKKYVSMKMDYINFILDLQENPIQGESLGKDCYKVRMGIESKNKGKSGGARVISCVKIIDEVVYLLAIYDKSEHSTLKDKEITKRVKALEEF